MQRNMIGRLLMPLATAVIMAVPATTLAQSSSGASSPSGGRKVESVVNGRRHVVLYDAAGKVIEVADEVQEKELPKPVADAMHSHPRAIYASGMKVTRGTSVEYRLTVRGTRKTSMVARPDGTVVSFK